MRAHFFCIFGISISTAAISIRPISLRPNRDVLHLVHRDDVGVGLEQVASLNFTMMMAGMRAVSSYANT